MRGLEHSVHTRGVVGSSPISATIYAEVAEQADAQDLKSCGSDTVPVRFRSSAPNKLNSTLITRGGAVGSSSGS